MVNFIAAALTVNGNGADTLNVDDTGSTVAKTGTLTSTSLTGLGMAGSITFFNLAVLNISLGSGGNTFIIASTSIASTTLNTGSGNDTVNVQSIGGPVTVNTGAGLNTLNVGSNLPVLVGTTLTLTGGVLTGIQGTLTINGNGSDILNVDDTGDTTGTTGTLTSTTLSGLGMATISPAIMTYQVEFSTDSLTWNVLGVVTGSAANLTWTDPTATPTSGPTGTYRVIELVPGGSNIVVSTTNTQVSGHTNLSWVNNILPALPSALPAGGIVYNGLKTLNISLGSGGNTFTVASTSTAATTLNSGSGADTVNVMSTTGTLTVNSGSGINTVNVGSPTDGIQGGLTVIGSGADTLKVDDSGSSIAKTGTLTSTTLTGLGMGAGGITYSGIAHLNILLGTGGNTFNVQSTFVSTITNLTTGTGTNTVYVGSLAPATTGIMDNIQGALIIVGSGKDTVNVDDTGSSPSKTGTLTATTLTGLGMGAAGITYSGVANLNISLGSGGNTFNVQSTFTSTVAKLTTGTGTNKVNVGSLVPTTGGIVDNIQGALIIVGSSNDTVNVDDTGSSASKTGTLTATTLTGLGMGAAGITYSGVANLNISLGSGGNTFNVQSTFTGTVTKLTTGTGTNTINIGSLAPATDGIVDNIQGALIVIGSGTDTMNVDDTGSSGDKTGTLSATTLTGLGMGAGGITYSGLTTLNITLGAGDDTFTITGINTPTVTTVDGGSGDNTAIIDVQGNLDAQNLTLLNFQFTSISVTGDFTGIFNDPGAITTFDIGGSFTAGSQITAGSIGTMTIGGDLAGLLTVTGLLDTLNVGGGTPGEIIAGNIHIITAMNAFGNKVLQVIIGGIERQIQANPVGGGVLPGTVSFAYVFDNLTNPGVPQLAIQINNASPVAHSFDLLLDVFATGAKFNLAWLSSNGSGISNVAVDGDILPAVSGPAKQFFGLGAGTRAGVILPNDNITGVEISGTLPIGEIDVAGIEGLAFAVLTSSGKPVTLLNVLGSSGHPQTLWNLLGSKATILSATDRFALPFGPAHSVTFYAHDTSSVVLNLVGTFTDQIGNYVAGDIANPTGYVTAYVQLVPAKSTPVIQTITFNGDGASMNSQLSIGSITTTGPLGDITVAGTAGLGSITAPSIFGNINVTKGAITGIIQTTGVRIDPQTGATTNVEANLGPLVLGPGGKAPAPSIYSKTGITGQIIDARQPPRLG